MSEEVKVQMETQQTPEQQERLRIASKVFNKIPGLVAYYKNLVRHTGGLLTESMTYAYTKGLNDALKLILKGDK